MPPVGNGRHSLSYHFLNNYLLSGSRYLFNWQNSFSKKTGICQMELCFFLREKDGRYRRIDETQKQRAHSHENLTAMLLSCGFTDVRLYGNSRMEAPRDKEQRWHLVARKPE